MNASGSEVKMTLKVMIMNTWGDTTGHGSAKIKKNAIKDCIKTQNPDLVLFQEFKWATCTWLNNDLPEYKYDGHKEASIFYKKDKLNVEKIEDQDLQDISQQFTAIDRISVHIIVSKKHIPDFNFVCLSWHGKNKPNHDDYESLMTLAENIHDEYELPILLGGDFNINWYDVKIKEPFLMPPYKASERREAKGVKDYFIITEPLDLFRLEAVNLNVEYSAVLDHDPVSGQLKQTEMSNRAREICTLLSELEEWTNIRPTYPRTNDQLENLKFQHEFQTLCNIVY